MFIRNACADAKFCGAGGVRHLLPGTSPAGGAYGYVRWSHTGVHQGWDLYAPVNTPVYAISEGTIVRAERGHKLGRYVVLQFPHGARKLYAVYAHLSHIAVGLHQHVKEGDVLAQSGTDGNAHGTPPHLHFEIRTIPDYSKGLHGRVNPGSILGGHYGLH